MDMQLFSSCWINMKWNLGESQLPNYTFQKVYVYTTMNFAFDWNFFPAANKQGASERTFVQATDNEGSAALHLAVQNGQIEVRATAYLLYCCIWQVLYSYAYVYPTWIYLRRMLT